MTDNIGNNKRNFLKGAAVLGGVASALGAAVTPRAAFAQTLESGINKDSTLGKILSSGILRVGYAQTGPFFYKNATDKRPSSWAARYGDLEWKNFLDFWARFVRVNGQTDSLMKHHVDVLSTNT